MARNEPLGRNKKPKKEKDISAKRLRELIKKYRPGLYKDLERNEIEYLKRLLMPPEEDHYIDYGFEQEVAKGGKVKKKYNYRRGGMTTLRKPKRGY
jgi:hypothetical protein